MAKQVEKKFIWVIKDFSSLQDETCSVPVLIGDFEWRLVAVPEGHYGTSLSLYVEAIGDKLLPSEWRRYAEYRLTIVNRISEDYSKKLVGRSWFDKKSPMWGFGDVIPLKTLNENNGGFLVNGELVITAEVDVFETIGTLYECDDSEWTALDYSSSSDDEDEDDVYVDFNGFEILRSQVEQAKEIFEKHPDLTSDLDLKNDWLKDAYVDVLVHLTKKLSKAPKELTEEDLNFAESAFSDLTKAGFKLDWLRQKLDMALEKQRACGARNVLQRLRGLYRNFF